MLNKPWVSPHPAFFFFFIEKFDLHSFLEKGCFWGGTLDSILQMKPLLSHQWSVVEDPRDFSISFCQGSHAACRQLCSRCCTGCFCAWHGPLWQPRFGFNDERRHLTVSSHRIYFYDILFFFSIALYGKGTCSFQIWLGDFSIFCDAETAGILGCVCEPVFFRE